MDNLQAVIEVIREAHKERGTVSGYKRVTKALAVLLDNGDDMITALAHLDYHNPDTRQPYKWLADKLK